MDDHPIDSQGEEKASTPETGSAWAAPVKTLKVGSLPSEAVNLNVEGRQLTGPLQGFGQLWQKTYRVRLSGVGVSPAEVIKVWKENFGQFWPEGNRFFGSMCGINPGDIAVLNLAGPGGVTGPGGMPLISTGVMVIYADDESFSFMTPQGHMFSAMITFSAYEDEVTVAQVQALIRASDPVYEMSLRLGMGHKAEDEFWHGTLKNLAAHFHVDGQIEQQMVCLDPRVRWSDASNIRYNALLRTVGFVAVTPARRFFSAIGRRRKPAGE
jgi:hypothetical protein